MNADREFTKIIFDFDYTLADSSQGVYACNNYALSNLGYPKTTFQKSCRTIGLSLWETFNYLTGEPPENGDAFVKYFIEHAEEVMADGTILFDETPETICKLKTLDYSLGIVSTKFRYRIETILSRENLLNPFDVIVGGEDVSKHKPDPESLKLAMDQLGASTTDTLYIGDSLIDALTAGRLGVPFIAVLSGVTPRSAFSSHRVLKILRNVSELPEWLQNSRDAQDT
jgi:phosphoglycolate phosphatase